MLLKLLFFTRHDSSFFSFSQSRISTVIIVVSLSFVDNDRGKTMPLSVSVAQRYLRFLLCCNL